MTGRPPPFLQQDERVMTRYLDVFELAEMLKVTPQTIRRNIRTRRWGVPQKMHIPGTSMLRWRADDVETWLRESQVPTKGGS